MSRPNGAPPPGAGSAAAGAAAAAAASAAKQAARDNAPKRTLLGVVGDRLNKDSGTLRSVAQSWASATSAYFEDVKTKGVKMPVHVDVDFIGPFALGVKRNALKTWRSLPPGARTAAPYVGTGVGSGGLAYWWQGRRVAAERARADAAAAELKRLTVDNGKLRDAVKTLRAANAVPRAAADVKSAAVVAEATAAAAAAAAAAAEAAKACAFKLRQG